MNLERIQKIMEGIKERTAWGVTLDAIELSVAKKEAQILIEVIEVALIDIEHFSNERIPDPLDKPKKQYR